MMASVNCLEVCFVGLMVGGKYILFLAIVAIFKGIGQAGGKL